MADATTPSAAPRLSLADQVLVNTLAAILLPVLHGGARERMLIGVLAEVLPAASREHPQMRPLIEAARGFLTGTVLDAPREVGAKVRAARPAADFFIRRAALALEAFRAAAKPEVADV